MARRGASPDTRDTDGEKVIAGLAADVVPSLIERLNQSGLGELEVRSDGWRVRLRRPGVEGTGIALEESPAPTSGKRSDARKEQSPARHGGRAPAGVPPQPDGALLGAPAVGYFVELDGMAKGAAVRAGDAVGQIDMLGVREDVVTTIDGVIARFEVEPGQAVEYGQPIARVRPAPPAGTRG
jgi:acetyl-CoA carboxylase biotin carboxyl carrier protein